MSEKQPGITSPEIKDRITELNKLREKEIREQMVKDQEGKFLAWKPKKMLEKFGDRVIAGTSALGIEGDKPTADLRIISDKNRFSDGFETNGQKFKAGRALGRLLRAIGSEKLDTHNLVKTALVHGNKIIKVDRDYLKESKTELAGKEADGLMTNLPAEQVILMTLNADCPSVTVFSPEANAIGLAHCGWKSLKAGILEELISTMRNEYGANISSLQVSVSPGAGELEYEVGEDRYREFIDEDSEYKQAFTKVDGKEGKFILNLNKIIELKILKAGINPDSFEASHLSSINSPFFASQRRQGDSRSTNVSLAGLLK